MTWFLNYGRKHLTTGRELNAEIYRYLRNTILSLRKMMKVSWRPQITVTVRQTDGSVLSATNALFSLLPIMRNTVSGAVQVRLREKH